MKPIQMHAILNRVATKSDGSLSLSFSTPELDAEETTVLIKLARINLTMLLRPHETTLQVPVEVKNELSRKTQSERLRGVLFVQFKHLADQGRSGGKTFEVFYHDEMERVIESIKATLPEE
jgi:hypothetical protein